MSFRESWHVAGAGATFLARSMPLAGVPAFSSRDGSSVVADSTSVPDIDALFRLHAPAVAKLGLAMLGRADEADDLVQDVFMRAMKGIHLLRDTERVRSWLITIAVRQGRTRLRRRKMSQLFFTREEMDYEALAAASGSAEDKLHIQRLFAVLDELAPALRVAWVLRFLEAEPMEGVAEKCGWSLSTTKRRVRKAHDFVSRRME